MKNIFKKHLTKSLFVLFIICLILSFSYSQNISDFLKDECWTWFEIKWLENIKKNDLAQYNVVGSDWKSFSWSKIYYKLYKDEKLINEYKWDEYSYKFKNSWYFYLKVNFHKWNCDYNYEKEVNVYDKMILYIWTKLDEFQLWFDENFKKHSIYFHTIILTDKKYFLEDEVFSKISENLNFIWKSDSIVLNSKNFDLVFQTLWNILKAQDLWLDKKNIYVSTEVNQNFIKRLLAKYVKVLSINKLYILDNDYFLNFLWEISFDKNVIEQKYIKPFETSFSNIPKYYIVSYFIDNLISNWFPVNLLWLFLVLSLSALVISIFRQMIGFSVFGIYSPLLFAVTMSVLWIKFSLIWFFIAFIATIITRLLTKKIYLLHSAKVSILIIFYFIFTILFFWFDKMSWLNIADFQVFNNSLIIFPFIFLILVWDKVFPQWFKMFSKWWFISFIEFFTVSVIVYFIIWWTSLNYFLLSYPEIIILIFILNILIWRFTWLQLLEYFRFIPLLRKWDEEE